MIKSGISAPRTFIQLSIFLLAILHGSNGLRAQTGMELDNALLDMRMAALRENGVAEDSEMLSAYKQLKNLLSQADSYNREAARYVETLSTAPQQEKEIQARMDARQEEVDADSSLGDLSGEELQARLVSTRSELGKAGADIETLDRQLAARETNVLGMRERLAEVNTRVEALPGDVARFDPEAKPSLAEAKLWRNTAEYLALIAERRAIEARLTSQPARYSVMAVQRAELALNIEQLSKDVRDIEAQLQLKVAEVVDARSLGILPEDPLFSLADRLTGTDAELREERMEINEKLATARGKLEEIGRLHRVLEDRFATARRVVEFAPDSDALGSVLLAYAREMDQFRISDPTEDLSRRVGGTVIRRITLEEELKQLSSAGSYILRQLEIEGIEEDAVPESSRAALVELVSNYRDRLRSVIGAESDYIETLGDLGDRYNKLTGLISEYDTYLRGLILWIPAHPPLWSYDTESVGRELLVLDQASRSIRLSFTPWSLFWVAIAALLLVRRTRLRNFQEELNRRISRPRHDSILHTISAIFVTFLRALPGPLLLLATSIALSPEAAARPVMEVALALAVLQFMRLVCSPVGIGPVHFLWPPSTMARLHKDLGKLIVVWLPLAVLTGFVVRSTHVAGDLVLSRMLITSLGLTPILLLASGLRSELRAGEKPWYRNTAFQVRLLLILVLLTVAIAIVLGHIYSVEVIFWSLLATVWIGGCLLLTHAVLMRWLRVTRRRLRLAELMEARQEQDSDDDGLVEEQEANLGDVSVATSQLINVGILAAALLSLFYIWSPLLPAFDAFTKITLWTSSAQVNGETIENRISLAMLMMVIFLASLTIFAARKLPALIDLVLRSRTTVSASARYTVSSLLNYVILGGGIVAALSALGLQWSQLQWLVAALGVGIGFGLQEIIANFISGIIILFERPIRVGDVVSTGGEEGVVTRIRIRATTIVDWNGKELLVPNKEFITGRLLNWSLSDPKVRTVLPVGVAYGSDVELAIKTLGEIVGKHPRVVHDPEPQIIFESFGDNALMLSARCFLNSVENRMGVVTEMNREIYRRFEQEGIVIAFPQRDIHLDTDKPLRIALESENGQSE